MTWHNGLKLLDILETIKILRQYLFRWNKISSSVYKSSWYRFFRTFWRTIFWFNFIDQLIKTLPININSHIFCIVTFDKDLKKSEISRPIKIVLKDEIDINRRDCFVYINSTIKTFQEAIVFYDYNHNRAIGNIIFLLIF